MKIRIFFKSGRVSVFPMSGEQEAYWRKVDTLLRWSKMEHSDDTVTFVNMEEVEQIRLEKDET